jgi:hypothetical protein
MLFKRLTVLLAAVGLALTMGVAPAQAAPADPRSAFGSVPVATFTYEFNGIKIKIPTGCFLSHYIQGKRTRVEKQNAGVDCAGPGALGPGFCNWRIDFIFYDLKGKHYLTHKGLQQLGCSTSLFWKNPKENWSIPHYGRACATLTVHTKERVRQCHAITDS